MSSVRYRGRSFDLNDGETVLDALLRGGVAVPHSCRVGACQSCVLRADPAKLPARCQDGLKATRQSEGYFLSCQCVPVSDLMIDDGDGSDTTRGRVLLSETVGEDVRRVRVVPETQFRWRAGQFVHLVRESDGLTRPYSAASRSEDGWIELHVRRLPGGRMSGWVHDELREGDWVTLKGPAGECFYVEGRTEQPLLLAGVGTGLAPLVGIVRDALARDHRGRILLVHGALVPERLYLREELTALASTHPTFQFVPCAVNGSAPGVVSGAINDVMRAQVPDLTGYRVFLCGDPNFVTAARRQAFLDGAASLEIHADAFLGTQSAPSASSTTKSL